MNVWVLPRSGAAKPVGDREVGETREQAADEPASVFEADRA
jgi:hypothetical protein